jgi:hypothetical protein
VTKRSDRWRAAAAGCALLLGVVRGSNADPAPEPAPPPEPPARRVTWGGTADLYASVGPGRPWTGRNTLRAFDVEDRDAEIAFAEVWVQCARKPFGFRLDVDAGETAELVNAFEPARGKAWEHVQQAFVSVDLSRSGSWWLDAGKWVTPAGAEVIEAKDNWLYSRGLLFNWAIPFYHAGIRVTHSIGGADYVMVHVNRGWNAVGDPGGSPGGGVTVSRALDRGWTVTGNYLGSDEASLRGGRSWLHLADLVLLWQQPDGKWSSTVNVDVAHQAGATWHGLSVQGRRALTSRDALTGRLEYLTDGSGRQFGQAMTATSATLGWSREWIDHLSTRAEYRHDMSTKDIFPSDDAPRTTGDEGTLTVAVLVAF